MDTRPNWSTLKTPVEMLKEGEGHKKSCPLILLAWWEPRHLVPAAGLYVAHVCVLHYRRSQGLSHMSTQLMRLTCRDGANLILKVLGSATGNSSQGPWNVWQEKGARRTRRHINMPSSDVIHPMKGENQNTEQVLPKHGIWVLYPPTSIPISTCHQWPLKAGMLTLPPP